jgi:hypothetical protein
VLCVFQVEVRPGHQLHPSHTFGLDLKSQDPAAPAHKAEQPRDPLKVRDILPLALLDRIDDHLLKFRGPGHRLILLVSDADQQPDEAEVLGRDQVQEVDPACSLLLDPVDVLLEVAQDHAPALLVDVVLLPASAGIGLEVSRPLPPQVLDAGPLHLLVEGQPLHLQLPEDLLPEFVDGRARGQGLQDLELVHLLASQHVQQVLRRGVAVVAAHVQRLCFVGQGLEVPLDLPLGLLVPPCLLYASLDLLLILLGQKLQRLLRLVPPLLEPTRLMSGLLSLCHKVSFPQKIVLSGHRLWPFVLDLPLPELVLAGPAVCGLTDLLDEGGTARVLFLEQL